MRAQTKTEKQLVADIFDLLPRLHSIRLRSDGRYSVARVEIVRLVEEHELGAFLEHLQKGGKP